MIPTAGTTRRSALYPRALYCAAAFLLASARLAANQASVTPMTASQNSGDGTWMTTTLGGKTAYKNTGTSHHLYFDVPASIVVTGKVYVRVEYWDEGVGLIELEYDADDGNHYKNSEIHARSSRVGNGTAYAYSYHRLDIPAFVGGQQSFHADFRLSLSADDGTPLMAVSNVLVSDTAFTGYSDPGFTFFQEALSQPWTAPYSGSSRNDVDSGSLKEKVMVGYQGWFFAPNDLQDIGWEHWTHPGHPVMKVDYFNTDMWPDVSAYPAASKVKAASVLTRNGNQGFLFSSADIAVVQQHFKWMRQYNIDGAFLQRFLKSTNLATAGYPQWALANVREAAHLEGRIWALEYDVSSLTNANLNSWVQADWLWLKDPNNFDLLNASDGRYAHEWVGGVSKPVVALYGLGNPANPDTQNPLLNQNAIDLINFFKGQGCYVWGGVPNNWLTLWNNGPDSSGKSCQDVYKAFDAISAWHSSNPSGDLAKIASVSGWNAQYWPIVWPGFSWSNLKSIDYTNSAYKPRVAGDFYWTGDPGAQKGIYNAVNTCVTTVGACPIFVGMFDEYDEGTAIMPMTDDRPWPPSPTNNPPQTWQGIFISNDGLGYTDQWLALTTEAKSYMLKQKWPITTTRPTPANRSNVGPEATVNLNSTAIDDVSNLYRVEVTYDGLTSGEYAGPSWASKPCRFLTNWADQTHDQSFYFNVDNSFIYQSSGQDVTIEVEYLDEGAITFLLEYDAVGTNNKYKQEASVTTTGSGNWRTMRWEISDAYFGNRENTGNQQPSGASTGTDFRLRVTTKSKLHLNRIWVHKP